MKPLPELEKKVFALSQKKEKKKEKKCIPSREGINQETTIFVLCRLDISLFETLNHFRKRKALKLAYLSGSVHWSNRARQHLQKM